MNRRKNNISIEIYLLKSNNFVKETLSKFRILAPESLWILVGQAGVVIAGLVGIKLLTYLLGPSEFGKLALVNTIVAFISVNLFASFGQGLMRFWAISKDRGNLDVFYDISNRIAKYVSLVALIIATVAAFVLSITKNFDWAIMVTLSLIVGGITGFFTLRIGIFTAARQRRRVAILDISSAILRPLIAIFLVVLTIAKVNIVILGYLLAGLFVLLITERLYSQTVSEASLFHLKSNAQVPLSQGLGKEILSYSLPFVVWGIFGWIHMSSDRWALQTFYGAEVVGAFAVVSQLSMFPLVFVSGFLNTLFAPIIFQKAGDFTHHQNTISANKLLGVVTGVYVLGVVMLVLLFSVFHYPLVLLISNIQFVEFSFLLPWLAAAWGLFYLGQMLSSFGLLAKKPQIYIMPKIVSAIVAGISTFYLSAKIGPVGVVWGLAIAGFIYALWCAIIACRLVGELQKGRVVSAPDVGCNE